MPQISLTGVNEKLKKLQRKKAIDSRLISRQKKQRITGLDTCMNFGTTQYNGLKESNLPCIKTILNESINSTCDLNHQDDTQFQSELKQDPIDSSYSESEIEKVTEITAEKSPLEQRIEKYKSIVDTYNKKKSSKQDNSGSKKAKNEQKLDSYRPNSKPGHSSIPKKIIRTDIFDDVNMSKFRC